MDLIEARDYHLREVRRIRGHDDTNHPTLRLYGLYERRHLEYLDLNRLDTRLDMLNPQMVSGGQLWIHEYHGYGARNGRTAEYAYARIMKIWSAFLFKRRIISQDLMLGFELPHVPKIQRRPFTREEAERLYSVAGDSPNAIRDRAIMLVLADTGCRVGELCGLQVSDVIEPDGTLRSSIRFRKTKGGVPRDVQIAARDFVGGGPCSEALRSWLRIRNARPDVQALFVSADLGRPWLMNKYTGEPLLPRRIRELHALWGSKAKVNPCFPHMWRHTAASEGMAEGVDENSIRDRMGHLSREVIHAYLHQNTRSRDRAAELSSLSTKWGLGQAPGATDLSVTQLKHQMEELLRGDPATVRQMLALAATLKSTGSLST